MPERIREHTVPVAAARRRRLRADQARQLADLLRHQVRTGGFPGGVLPLEGAIGDDYRVSRNTVRQALDLLRTEGLVERQPGVGTVVVSEKYSHGLDRLQGLAETLHEHGDVTNEVRTVGPVAAPAPVARRLGLTEHTDVLCIERLRRLNGLPLSLDLTYIPMDIGSGLLGCDLEHTDVFRLLETLTGQPLGTAEITWRPSTPTRTPPPYSKPCAARPYSCWNDSPISPTDGPWTWSSSASAATASP